MKKPYVICHMMSTLNGKIITANWGNKATVKQYSGLYEKYHDKFGAEAWLVGRVTMEKDFTGGTEPEPVSRRIRIERKPFIGNEEAESFAIAVDAGGKLGWDSNEIDGDHVIVILSEKVSDRYLAYLQEKQVSYLFAGEKEINFKSALRQLVKHFPIETLMLEGGGHVNGSLLNEGLIDEVSLLLLPLVDGTPGTPTTFEMADYLNRKKVSPMKLTSTKRVENDVLWLRYKAKE